MQRAGNGAVYVECILKDVYDKQWTFGLVYLYDAYDHNCM